MDLTKLNKLTVLTPKNSLGTKTENQGTTKGSNIISLNKKENGMDTDKMLEKYLDVRKGLISEHDFKNEFTNLNSETINSNLKSQVTIIMVQTLKWYIQIKLLLSTGLKVDNLKEFLNDISNEPNYNDLINPQIKFLLECLDDPSTYYNKIDPKESSNSIMNLLSIFIEDDLIRPKYDIDLDMLTYLANSRPTFLKEITLLFDLYAKVYLQHSKDLITNKQMRQLDEIQPRFNMINNHILSSNLKTKVSHNLDLNKLNISNSVIEAISGIEASKLGLQKRLKNLNNWLINGIIHIQISLNRLHGLKPVTQEGKEKLITDANTNTINSNYELWLILNEVLSFLDSLKNLADGTAFISGMSSKDQVLILDVNY